MTIYKRGVGNLPLELDSFSLMSPNDIPSRIIKKAHVASADTDALFFQICLEWDIFHTHGRKQLLPQFFKLMTDTAQLPSDPLF